MRKCFQEFKIQFCWIELGTNKSRSEASTDKREIIKNRNKLPRNSHTLKERTVNFPHDH